MLENLSAKQRLAIQHITSDKTLFLAQGSVRSGKTACCSIAFALAAANYHGDHIAVGRTQDSIERNVINAYPLGVLATLRAIGWKAEISGVGGRHVSINKNQSRIWLVGASDSKTDDRIAGSTFRTGLVDELTRLHDGQKLWPMLWTRHSTPPRKIWATTNPGNISSWVKRQIVDNPARYNAHIIKYDMSDNPGLDTQAKKGIESGLTGHHYQRLILGEWANPTGRIYDQIPLANPHRTPLRAFCGLDWAASGTFAAVIITQSPDGTLNVSAERTHDHREEPITDVEQAIRTNKWIREHANRGIEIYGDPTTPTAFQYLLQRFGHKWIDGATDVLPGIQGVASGLNSKHLTINPQCVKTIQEAEEYSWDEKAAEQGEDKPIKQNDHLMDSIRYAYSTPSNRMRVHYRGGP